MGTATRIVDQLSQLADVSIVGVGGGALLHYDAAAGAWEESTKLHWDEANGRLGIGTETPESQLHVRGNVSSPDDLLRVTNVSADRFVSGVSIEAPNLTDSDSVSIYLGRRPADGERATVRYMHGSPSHLSLDFYGVSRDLWRLYTDGKLDVGGTGRVAEYSFQQRSDNIQDGLALRSAGPVFLTGFLRVDSEGRWRVDGGTSSARAVVVNSDGDGSLGVGIISPVSQLDVAGTARVGGSTFGTLPSAAATPGALLRITDRDQRHAYSDGSDWRFLADDTVVS